MTLKINTWLATALLVLMIILACGWLKSCGDGTRKDIQYQKQIIAINDSIDKASTDYRTGTEQQRRELQDSLQFFKGQSDLIQNQKDRLEESLDLLAQENKSIIAKYKSSDYTDTTRVVTHQGFVDNCADCMANLEQQTNQVNIYKIHVKSTDSLYKIREQLHNNYLEFSTAKEIEFLRKLDSLTDAQRKAASKLKRKGALLLSLQTQSFNQPFPNAAGVGLIYQDKKNRQVGFSVMGGEYGTIYHTQINMPLTW